MLKYVNRQIRKQREYVCCVFYPGCLMALGTRGNSALCLRAPQLHCRSCSVRPALENQVKQLARAREEKVLVLSAGGEAEGKHGWEQASFRQQGQCSHVEDEAGDPSPDE